MFLRNDIIDLHFGPAKLKQANHTEPCPLTGRLPRQAMKANSKALKVYNDKYVGQMEDIIKALFAKEALKSGRNPAADPNNWHMSQNIVWGGTEHQHPHCDQAKAGSFVYDEIFPFVCIHGFGVHEFIMWLLPAKAKREYGFPFKFPKNAILFMRGDFIHAGWYSQLARAHMEFFPKAAAGWTRTRYPYWATEESLRAWQLQKTTFLIPDMRTFPFAYPEFTEEDELGNQTVCYPSLFTDDVFPHLEIADNLKAPNTSKDEPDVKPLTRKRKLPTKRHQAKKK